MSKPALVMFLGTEMGGWEPLAKKLQKAGLRCGSPYPVLQNPLACRHMPPHENLVYWTAIRRFFADMGLPPIAEVPPDRITPEERAYYIALFTRCLHSCIEQGSFICADFLTALALPLVYPAIMQACCNVRLYFFFSNPSREAAALRQLRGQPTQLSEFIWRNTVSAAIRHNRRNIRFVAWDRLDKNGLARLEDEIISFYGCRQDIHPGDIPDDPGYVMTPPCDPSLSPLTKLLYEALCDHDLHRNVQKLEAAAETAYAAQVEQNGWQYVNCLDCGDVDAHAQLLMGSCGSPDASLSDSLSSVPAGQWEMIEALELKLMQARQDFASQLFLHTDSLNRFFHEQLDDLRRIDSHTGAQNYERRARLRKRHKRRLRAIWQKRSGTSHDHT